MESSWRLIFKYNIDIYLSFLKNFKKVFFCFWANSLNYERFCFRTSLLKLLNQNNRFFEYFLWVNVFFYFQRINFWNVIFLDPICNFKHLNSCDSVCFRAGMNNFDHIINFFFSFVGKITNKNIIVFLFICYGLIKLLVYLLQFILDLFKLSVTKFNTVQNIHTLSNFNLLSV